MYDLPRLTAALQRSGSRSAADQIQAVVDDLGVFAGDREPEDDQTLVIMEME